MRIVKIASIALVVLVVLALGASLALAQDADSTPANPPGAGSGNGSGAAVCSLCVQTPGTTGGGMMNGQGMAGGMMNSQGMAGGMMNGGAMMGGNPTTGGGAMMGGGMVAGPGGMMNGRTLPDIAAEQLGLTVEQVVAELSAGISIAQLAENHGQDGQAIVDAFLAERQAALDAAVEAGTLSQVQADQMAAHMAPMIQNRVEQPWRAAGNAAGPCHGGQAGMGAGAQ
jgi:hypothetical protein